MNKTRTNQRRIYYPPPPPKKEKKKTRKKTTANQNETADVSPNRYTYKIFYTEESGYTVEKGEDKI